MAETKRRGRKTTLGQMEIIINFMKSNKIFATGKCLPSQPKELDLKWEELSNQLNSEAGGANKTNKQWRTFVSEWKSRVRKKARIHRENLVRTGGGGYFHQDLSELENRLMGATGWLPITGNEELPQEIDSEEPVSGKTEIDEQTIQYEELPAETFAAEQFAAEEEATAEAEEMNLPQNVSARENRRKRPRMSRMPKRSQLQESAELFNNAAARSASSNAELATSVSLLALSINNFANALNNYTNQLNNNNNNNNII